MEHGALALDSNLSKSKNQNRNKRAARKKNPKRQYKKEMPSKLKRKPKLPNLRLSQKKARKKRSMMGQSSRRPSENTTITLIR